jgi:rhodanese-related sulfurtransferase
MWDGVKLTFAGFLIFALLGGAALAAELSATDAQARIRTGELVLIDVRSVEEWRTTGVPEGARTISVHGDGGYAGFAATVAKLYGDRKDRPIALICARGGRSARALGALREVGFTRLFDVDEGVLGSRSGPGWIGRGLPIRPCDC